MPRCDSRLSKVYFLGGAPGAAGGAAGVAAVVGAVAEGAALPAAGVPAAGVDGATGAAAASVGAPSAGGVVAAAFNLAHSLMMLVFAPVAARPAWAAQVATRRLLISII